MCGLYVAMGLGWLMVCALHWRDLLRIQFWIGAVIFLGMLEKAMFYAEFQNINSTGIPTRSLIVLAEVVSCAKRTLARYKSVWKNEKFTLSEKKIFRQINSFQNACHHC